MTIIASKIGFDWYDIIFGTLYEMTKGKSQSEGFDLQICYLLGLIKLNFGIIESLHIKKWLNSMTVVEFLKMNTATTA